MRTLMIHRRCILGIILALMIVVVVSPAYSQAGNITVLPEDQMCEVDSDCTRVGTDCQDCGCGMPVNKSSQQKYWKMIQEECRDYKGPICEPMCLEVLKCENKSCTWVPSIKTGKAVNPNPSLSSPSASAHIGHIKQMKEASFKDDELQLDEGYRLWVISGWGNTRMFRIVKSADQYPLVVKESTGGGHYDFVETKKMITDQQWNHFLNLVNEASFWEMEQQDYSKVVFDGTVYVLEALKQGRYHVVERWEPEDGAFKALCDELIGLGK